MLSEQQLALLPVPIQKHFRALERDIVTRLAEHIGRIGAVTPTDLFRLEELRNIGYDMQEIEHEISVTSNRAETEIHGLLSGAAESEYISLDTAIPFGQNRQLHTLIQSIEQATAGTLRNISNTSTIGLLTRSGNVKPIAAAYQNSIDYAVTQLRTGQTDFYSAIRQTVKNLSDGGARVIYPAGATRRLDTAVRQNILGAQAELSKQQAEITGQQFGANGWELSYHSGHRPSHWFGGRQFTKQEFDRQGIGALMDEWNCYHRKFPIIIGISQPTYSAEQLQEFDAKQKETHEFNGQQFTKYEATQRQRQFETAIRQKRDEANAYTALADGHIAGGGSKGDALYKQYKETATLARGKAQAINQEYIRFSEKIGLYTQPKRISVPK